MSPHRTPEGYSWTAKLLATAVVLSLGSSACLFLKVGDLQQQIADGRRERNHFQAEANDKLCALLAVQMLVPRGKFAELCSP